jgi:hypothetical protein
MPSRFGDGDGDGGDVCVASGAPSEKLRGDRCKADTRACGQSTKPAERG